jgi:hypothetical protein
MPPTRTEVLKAAGQIMPTDSRHVRSRIRQYLGETRQ